MSKCYDGYMVNNNIPERLFDEPLQASRGERIDILDLEFILALALHLGWRQAGKHLFRQLEATRFGLSFNLKL